MALIPYEPFRLFDPLWNDMDRMFMRRGKEDVSEWLYRVDVKTDGAHASYRNGILELSFLKDQHPAARRIDVDFN